MKLNAVFFTLAAFSEALRREQASRTRHHLLAAQQRRLTRFLDSKAARVPAFAGFAGLPLSDWPVMDKAALMGTYARYNRLGLTAAAGWTHLEAGSAPEGYAIGASTGTSGSRGLYVVSERERYRWLGTILARALPDVRVVYAGGAARLLLAEDDAAIDGHNFELEREALAVLVRPGGTDFVPERFLALVCDVPRQKVGRLVLLRAVAVAVVVAIAPRH